MRYLGATLCMLLLFGNTSLYAAEDTFIINQGVTGVADVVAPSIPANLTATAVATTQIDLSWDASTDNVAVDGYQVFRDGAQVATTSVTNYSDVGLTPNTMYAYTVTAFDTSGNISAQSATATATTLAPDDDGGISGGGVVHATFVDLEVIPGQYAATINWQTRGPARSVVRWGETSAYELGSLSERAYRPLHSTRLTELQPNTQYVFVIEATDRFGNTRTRTGTFTTLPLPDTQAPENVRNFQGAIENDIDVRLTWDNPTADDFSHVRIIRSGTFYPADPYDGKLIYEGDGTEFLDQDALRDTENQYYTIFAYDEVGNVSSGAVTSVHTGDIPPPFGGATTTPSYELKFSDFSFFQNGRELAHIGNEVFVDGTQNLRVEVDYDILPEHLKTILATFTDPNDSSRTFSFLLRVNEEKTVYTATIAAFGDEKVFPLTISVFDFTERTISKVQGNVIASVSVGFQGINLFRYLALYLYQLGFLFWLLLILLLLIAYRLIKRDGQEKRHTLNTEHV